MAVAGLLANRLEQPGESPWVVVAATARSIPPRPDLAGWRPAARKASSTAVGMATTTAMSRQQEAAGMATAMGMVAVAETVDPAAGRLDLAPPRWIRLVAARACRRSLARGWLRTQRRRRGPRDSR
uniref:Uncharacterized protein n=1 Tax=Oryza meridionalis TaxID=40149 RepID=A0A0E0CHX6_9ORYZ